LGIVGVNLIHAAYTKHHQPDKLVEALMDGLSVERIEVDMIDFGGEAFEGIDNRVMTLRLVQLGLTGAAMFSATGEALQPSEALRKKSLLVQRGRFRPVTHVNVDMLEAAQKDFREICGDDAGSVLPIMEISMHNLMESGEVCLEDFVSRAEVASTTGCTVMVSDFREYHRLAAYLSRYTEKPIALAMGLDTLKNLFDENYYADLDGGILESFGRLFKENLRLLVYPRKNQENGEVESLSDIAFEESLQHLFAYLCDRKSILGLNGISDRYLDIHSPVVLKMISDGEDEWTEMVPECVSSIIMKQKLFGYTG